MSVAAKVRERKRLHPEDYCVVASCLWRTGGANGSPCKKHAAEARMAAARAIARQVVAANKCPQCGRPLRRNLALTGWWQCSQFGAEAFRADATQPSCDFQCFTD